MVCAMSCGIAFIFIIANIYCCSFGDKTRVIQDFVAKLSPENQQRYAVITKERQGIYFMGLFLGFVISMILMVCCRKYFIGSRGGLLCMIAAVTFSVNYFYYILSPKSDWMVLHLKSAEETTAWLNVYRTMQYNYHIGLVLGILAVVAFGNAFCGSK
jgi:glucan phosphoethanolaminetransferase (alkaline phosphatase superfamily)